jgi:hypothetical protein
MPEYSCTRFRFVYALRFKFYALRNTSHICVPVYKPTVVHKRLPAKPVFSVGSARNDDSLAGASASRNKQQQPFLGNQRVRMHQIPLVYALQCIQLVRNKCLKGLGTNIHTVVCQLTYLLHWCCLPGLHAKRHSQGPLHLGKTSNHFWGIRLTTMKQIG